MTGKPAHSYSPTNIRTSDLDIRKRGRWMQLLICGVFLVALSCLLARALQVVLGGLPIGDLQFQIGGVAILSIISLVSWQVVRLGRPVLAAHLFFIVADLLFLGSLIYLDEPSYLPFLLLLSVLAIAAIDSIRSSIFYAAAILIVVPLYQFLSASSALRGSIEFVIVNLALILVFWAFVDERTDVIISPAGTEDETDDSQALLEKEAAQLRLIAEISRVALASLEFDALLHDIVEAVNQLFGYDFVTVMLRDKSSSHLTVGDASGDFGRKLKEQPFEDDPILEGVVESHEALLIEDVLDHPGLLTRRHLPGVRSEIVLPLEVRGRIVGLLNIQSKVPSTFRQEDVDTLQLMSNLLASGMASSQAYGVARSSAEFLGELQAISRLMNQQTTIENAFNVLAQRALPLLHSDVGSVWLWREEEKRLVLSRSFGPNFDPSNQLLVQAERLADETFATDESSVVYRATGTLKSNGDGGNSEGFAVLAVPMRRQSNPIGVLTLTRRQRHVPFSKEAIQAAESIAAQAVAIISHDALIVENRRLARRERLLNQVVGQVQSSLDTQTILENTARSLGEALGDRTVEVLFYQGKSDQSLEAFEE